MGGVLYHATEYKLSLRITDEQGRFLLQSHKYTPDFKSTLKTPLKPFQQYFKYREKTIIDVKGAFSRFHDQKSFNINQKWVYSRYGMYVQKVVPEKLFKKTFVPELCRYTPIKGKLIKKYKECRLIGDYA